MKRVFTLLIVSLFLSLLFACGSRHDATRPQMGCLMVFSDDSCHCIDYDDVPGFVDDFTNISLYYNDMATVQTPDGHWGFVNRVGEFKLPSVYDRTTVFSEGLAWVVKKGNMPSAVNVKGDVKISLRDCAFVRVFYEGRAACGVDKRGKVSWGFIDKNGNEVIKPRYKEVKDFCLGRAAVCRYSDGKWGYIDLAGEEVVPCIYQEAYSFDEKGMALVKVNNQYLVIDCNGVVLRELMYDKALPDKLWTRVGGEQGWGWCDENGSVAIAPQFEDVRPFGNADLAPVKIRGKWGYVDRYGKVVIKRQFTEAYPFVDGRAAVKTGTVWGFIDKKGVFKVNPQYEYISQDYLYQALGLGSALSTLRIE